VCLDLFNFFGWGICKNKPWLSIKDKASSVHSYTAKIYF
jgi:hypothetical protein